LRKRIPFDVLFLMIVLVLIVIGITAIYSAGSYLGQAKYGSSQYFLIAHLMRLTIGLLLMVLFIKIDFRYLLDLSPALLGFAVLLLLYVLFNGAFYNGSRRAFLVGGISFQPSEFAKIALILYLAKYFADNRKNIEDFNQGLMPALVALAVVVFFIALEPDLGSAVIIFIIAMIMIFLAGASFYHLTALASATVVVISIFLKLYPYQLQRISSYFSAIRGVGKLPYQITQSLISFGNGGVFGVGLGNSRQKMHFLPYPYNDFIFSIIGEEMGLIGCAIILTLFLLLLWRGMWIATHAPDKAGQLLAIGIIASITIYALFNAGIALNLLPVTGITMPFISYGGSSLIMNLVGVGILLNISMQNGARRYRSGRKSSYSKKTTKKSRNVRRH